MSQDRIKEMLENGAEVTVQEIADYLGTNYNTAYIYVSKMYKKGELSRRKKYVGAKKHPTYYYYKLKEESKE